MLHTLTWKDIEDNADYSCPHNIRYYKLENISVPIPSEYEFDTESSSSYHFIQKVEIQYILADWIPKRWRVIFTSYKYHDNGAYVKTFRFKSKKKVLDFLNKLLWSNIPNHSLERID